MEGDSQEVQPMARKHALRVSARYSGHGPGHPHDPSHVIEWILMMLAAAMAITMVCALAFQFGRP
jgi:hypothetical protein